MALARFDKFARQAQARDSADGLRDEAHAAFAPLFGGGLSPHAGSRSKQPWGLALQDTVNDLGTEAFDKSRWTPLRDDGWIGPKTTDARTEGRRVGKGWSVRVDLGCRRLIKTKKHKTTKTNK